MYSLPRWLRAMLSSTKTILCRCQSIVLNIWSVTLHNNRRIACSLFQGWGEEGLPLGGALAAVRGDAAVKPRSRFCTVLYGLPTLKYGP